MEIKYGNFNGIRHDDYGNIIKFDRLNFGNYYIDEESITLYVLRFYYKDGTERDIRLFCNTGTSEELRSAQEKESFFVKRLFGTDGLIVKEKRNDYVYLGGISRDNSNNYKYSRFNKTTQGIPMQQLVDDWLSKNVYPKLTFKSTNEKFDVINMSYLYHTGNEDMNEVFTNGLRSQFGNKGPLGFASLTSTFSNSGGLLNNLHDSVRNYGEQTHNLGNYVFILRIPDVYRGKTMNNGQLWPPLPTHKLVDSQTGDSYIIPELIYGMYDRTNGVLHKNPNYRPKYDPSGLIYDEETAKQIRDKFPVWFEFMENRKNKTFQELYKFDKAKCVYDEICQFYGIQQQKSLDGGKKR